MPLLYPDILQNNNPNYALVDITEIKGNSYPVETLTDIENIPADKRKIGAIVYVQDTTEFYGFRGGSILDWEDLALWEILGSGGSSGEGDLQTTLDSGSEASVNKDIKIGIGEYNNNIEFNYEEETVTILSSGSAGTGAISLYSYKESDGTESSSSIRLNGGAIILKGNKLGTPSEGDFLVAANDKGSTKWTGSAVVNQDLQDVLDNGSLAEVSKEININSGDGNFGIVGSVVDITGVESVNINAEGGFNLNSPAMDNVSEEGISNTTNNFTVLTTAEEPNIQVTENSIYLKSNDPAGEFLTSLTVGGGNIKLSGTSLGDTAEGYFLTSADGEGNLTWSAPSAASDLQATLNAGSTAEIEEEFSISAPSSTLDGLEGLSLTSTGEISLNGGLLTSTTEESIQFNTGVCEFNIGGDLKITTSGEEEDLLVEGNTVTVKSSFFTSNTRTISAHEQEYLIPGESAELPDTRMFIASGSAEVEDTVNVSLPDATTTSIGRIYDFVNILENASLTINSSIENQIFAEGLVSSFTIGSGESISFVSNTKFWIPC